LAKGEKEALKGKIKGLEDMGEGDSDLAKGYKTRLAELEPESAEPAVGGLLADSGMNEEEFDQIGVKTGRPTVGKHLAEIGIPVDYSPSAYKVPITIIEPGLWEGYDQDAFYPTKTPTNRPDGSKWWPLKDLAVALGVEPKVVNGRVAYNLMDFAGKKFLAEYKDESYRIERDDGQVFEGTSSKLKRALPYHEGAEELF